MTSRGVFAAGGDPGRPPRGPPVVLDEPAGCRLPVVLGRSPAEAVFGVEQAGPRTVARLGFDAPDGPERNGARGWPPPRCTRSGVDRCRSFVDRYRSCVDRCRSLVGWIVVVSRRMGRRRHRRANAGSFGGCTAATGLRGASLPTGTIRGVPATRGALQGAPAQTPAAGGTVERAIAQRTAAQRGTAATPTAATVWRCRPALGGYYGRVRGDRRTQRGL